MAHFALVENNLVVKVIVAEQEYINTLEGTWVQTSYNTRGGIHYQPNTNTPSEDQSKALRKNFAGIGFKYDQTRDAFIPPQPQASWTLNEDTCQWQPPVAYPTDGKNYTWNEDTETWSELTQE